MRPSVLTLIRYNVSHSCPGPVSHLFSIALESKFVVALTLCSRVPLLPGAVLPLQVGPTPPFGKRNCPLHFHWAPAPPWNHCPSWAPLPPPLDATTHQPPWLLDTMIISVSFITSRKGTWSLLLSCDYQRISLTSHFFVANM